MKTVVIAGPCDSKSGYGYHTREVVRQFIEKYGDKWDIKILNLWWGITPNGALDPEADKDIIDRFINKIDQQPDIWVQVTIPNEFQRYGKHMNIGVTAGIEADGASEAWVRGCNNMDLIICPSQFAIESLQGGQTEKVKLKDDLKFKVVPEYFEMNDEEPTGEVSEYLNSLPESQLFLTVGHWLPGGFGQDRKDMGRTILAFLKAFESLPQGKQKPALVMKTSGGTYSIQDRLTIENKIRQIAKSLGKTEYVPKVYLLHGDLTDSDMAELYSHPKIVGMISLTHGEGFGRPLLEFSFYNKPIFVTGWSGQTQFLKAEFSNFVRFGMADVPQGALSPEYIKQGAKWAFADDKDLIKQLKAFKKNPKPFNRKAKQQGHYSRTNFSKEVVSDLWSEILDDADKLIPETKTIKLPDLTKVEK